MRRSILALVTVGLLAFATGCVKVAPYERGMLAHPTMTPEEISIGLDGHVRAVSEGAAGALAAGDDDKVRDAVQQVMNEDYPGSLGPAKKKLQEQLAICVKKGCSGPV